MKMKTTIKLITIVIAATAITNIAHAETFDHAVSRSAAMRGYVSQYAGTATEAKAVSNLQVADRAAGGASMRNQVTAAQMATASSPTSENSVAQGQQAVSHASRMLAAANARVTAAQVSYDNAAYQLGSGVVNSPEAAALNDASANRAAAQASLNGAINSLANAVSTSAKVSVVTSAGKVVNSSINVPASSLKPATQVNVTMNGVTQVTTAATIAAVNPNVQIAVPYESAFTHSRTGNRHDKAGHNASHGSADNNGQANAHASAFGGGRNADGGHFH